MLTTNILNYSVYQSQVWGLGAEARTNPQLISLNPGTRTFTAFHSPWLPSVWGDLLANLIPEYHDVSTLSTPKTV